MWARCIGDASLVNVIQIITTTIHIIRGLSGSSSSSSSSPSTSTQYECYSHISPDGEVDQGEGQGEEQGEEAAE